ncbi:MAG TPA: ATP-binding protein [Candidatus Kapabacteria bacterium]|nr:ATP-binding protein [Candidatus Kapabacteria bacterium]
MNNNVSIEELRKVIALSDVPEEHLRWILDHSELHEFTDGDIIARTGAPAEVMWIVLEGRIDYYMDVNGTLVYYFTFENNSTTGGITGLLPHSRMKTYAGTSFCVGHLRALALHKDHFAELEKLNPELIQRLIGYMTERARMFATIQLQREKVSALGKLSAGIAHELNNPAAAISRIAAELRKRLNLNYGLTSTLLTGGVSSEQIENIRAIAKEKESGKQDKHSALEKMNAEDVIADWFSDNGFAENHQAAETFSEFEFSTGDLEQIRKDVPNDTFIDLLRWLENILISDRLINDLEEASSRISQLVGAIKSHVHMDRTNDAQKTNIHTDIENTLTLMGYKLRDKNITLKKTFVDDMPMIDAYIGELNQVWTNLIDNAIDAMEKGGTLTIETSFDPKNATVRVIDNGSGIAKEIQTRIFDPFFTTKKVGQGTGIGLDTVKHIIDHHHGEIKVESVPGRTQFAVCIPRVQL